MRKIKLGDVLTKKNLRLKDVSNMDNPLVLGVTNNEGVVKSKIDAGQKIEDYFVIEKGDFIYNPYRINVGSIGISDLDGITSLAYVVFNVDETQLNKYLLFKLLKSEFGIKEIIRNGRGSVRNALRFDDLAKIEFILPSIEKQNEFIKEFNKKEENLKKLKNQYSYQLTQLENLNQAILQEAVQGKLVPQDPKDEPACELLKRIKAENLNRHGVSTRAKKEKTLPPIQPEELKIGGSKIPFEIPENWVWCRLGEICEINPRNKVDDELDAGFIPMPMVSQLFGVKPTFEVRKWRAIKTGFTHFANNDVVVAKITPCFENSKAGIISDLPNGIGAGTTELNVLRGNQYVLPEYIYAFVKRIYFLKNGERIMKGVAGQQRVPTEYFYNTLIPLPPLSEQKRIVAEIEKQFAKTKQLKEHIIASQQATEQLLKALLHQAFELKEDNEKTVQQVKGKVVELKPTNVDYYRRTVLATEIVWQLHKEPTLGHLKLQKLIYLCQKSADMQLPTNFLRQAMGPYDPQLMRSIDKQLKEKKWFEYKKEETLKYQPLEKAGQHHNDFIKYFSEESQSIQFIIDRFKTIKSDIVEIVATLYACIDNILNENAIFSEALLIQRFYEWSDEKKKFSEDQIKRVFSRMKETGIVPKGYNF